VLLSSPTVQKELQMSPDQVTKGKQLARDYQEEATRMALNLIGNPLDLIKLSPAERDAKLEDAKLQAEKVGKKLGEKYKPKAEALLNAEQTTRLQQIGWQMVGGIALTDPILAEGVELTDDQKTKLDDAFKTFTEKQAAAITASLAGDAKGAMAKMQESAKECHDAIATILTPEQTAKYKSLLGKPADIAAITQDMSQNAAGTPAPKPSTPAPRSTTPAPKSSTPAPRPSTPPKPNK
jgi:hypothetical protein